MDLIEFKHVEYPLIALYLEGYGHVTISTTNLSDVLMEGLGKYVSEIARYIDEKIFYYIDPEDVWLPEEKLKLKILQNLK